MKHLWVYIRCGCSASLSCHFCLRDSMWSWEDILPLWKRLDLQRWSHLPEVWSHWWSVWYFWQLCLEEKLSGGHRWSRRAAVWCYQPVYISGTEKNNFFKNIYWLFSVNEYNWYSLYNLRTAEKSLIDADWCNGRTEEYDYVSRGSSPLSVVMMPGTSLRSIRFFVIEKNQKYLLTFLKKLV